MTNQLKKISSVLSQLLIGSCLVACSSQPVVINQYLLNLSHSSESTINNIENDVTVLVTDISLPDYLKNRSLVMQQSNGLLSVATKHVWAQPLDSDFGATLANALSDHNGVSAYFAPQSTSILRNMAENSDMELAISVEHFMPLESGEVVLTGHWQLSRNTPQPPKKFNLVLPMTENGYAHSVSRMRELIKTLATLIKEEMDSDRIAHQA